MKTKIVSVSSNPLIKGQSKLAAHLRGLVRKFVKNRKGKLDKFILSNGEWKHLRQVIAVDVIAGDLVVRAENGHREAFTLTVSQVVVPQTERSPEVKSEAKPTHQSWAQNSWFAKNNQPIPKYAYYYHAYGL